MSTLDPLDRHRNEPDKSLEAYLHERSVALGQSIAVRHKVYLDTKFWLLLRDDFLRRSHDPVTSELRQLLAAGVTSAKLICPVSANIFLEILGQADEETLKCSVDLIDGLSEGVSVLSPEERQRLELLHFVRKHVSGESKCCAPTALVWTKVAYVLGLVTPSDTPFPPEEQLAIQKAFLDELWEISLTQMIDAIGMDAIRDLPRLYTSSELNRGKFEHASDAGSFQEMFLVEMAEGLDVLRPVLAETLVHFCRGHIKQAPTQQERAEAGRMFSSLIYHAFRENLITTELPSLRIPATLHAAIRWDRIRKYKDNDLHDIDHAIAALPYFDTFLTERSLRHLVTRNDLALDLLYSCEVISDPKLALDRIRAVVRQ